MSRHMVSLIHADRFLNPAEVDKLRMVVSSLQFVPKDYGLEIDNFNLITPGIEEQFSKVVGEPLMIDEPNSGVFRKPMFGIHFESFASLDEWCFMVALEPVTFNIYHHQSGARSALDGYQFNYKNLFEWENVNVNIELKQNQGIFFRPWLFHSCDHGVMQYFKLLPKK